MNPWVCRAVDTLEFRSSCEISIVMARFLLFLNLSLFLNQACSGQQTTTERIDSVIMWHLMKNKVPGIAVGITYGNSFRYEKGFGVLSVKTCLPVTEHSVFHAASISKIFTATAVMLLTESGHLHLDQTLRDIVPTFKMRSGNYDSITLRQLLHHTSGIPDIRVYNWNKPVLHPEALPVYAQSLKSKKQLFQPGTHYQYSNAGYNLLGLVIERKSGQSFEAFITEKVLNPAGMSSSTFAFTPDTTWALPHSKSRLTAKVYERKVYPYSRSHAPSSTLHTSAYDLCTWMRLLLNVRQQHTSGIISQAVLDTMWTPESEKHQTTGLGWQLGKHKGERIVFHFGGDKGFRSLLVLFPERELGIALLMNADFAEDLRTKIVFTIADLLEQNE